MTPAEIDGAFHALADPTRRDIVRRTMTAQISVSALARDYPMSFAAVQKHVAVLERAHLVQKHRHGREQLVRAIPATIRRTTALLDQLESLWRDRIDRMDAVLAADRDPHPPRSRMTTTVRSRPGATP